MFSRFPSPLKPLFTCVTALLILTAQVPAALGQDDEFDSLLSNEPTKGETADAPKADKTPAVEPDPAQPQAAQEKPAKASAEASSNAETEPRIETIPVAGEQDLAKAPPRQRATIEEIVVTAQKREESIQDVPIAMSVMGAEFLSQEAIVNLQDALRFVPNTSISQSAFLNTPTIRGFSFINVNKAFEPPVGLVLDGVPYPNSTYFQVPFLDVERIEVLRGVQGTTFGKNTTAGVLNIVSKDPTDEYTGFIDVQPGDLSRRRIEGAIGGPLIKNFLNFRAAIISDQRNGYVKNTTASISGAPKGLLGRDHKGLRFKFEFPDLAGSVLKLGYERFETNFIGDGQELFDVAEDVKSFFRGFDPKADFEFGNFTGSEDLPGIGRISDVDTFAAAWSYPLAGWGLDAIAGYSLLGTKDRFDNDRGPAPAIVYLTEDDNSQATFEFRVSSPDLPGLLGLQRLFNLNLGGSDLLLGLFYQRRGILNSASSLRFYVKNWSNLTARANASSRNGGRLSGPVLPLQPNAADDQIEQSTLFFNQSTDDIAAFGQLNWHFAERWRLQSGMRLSNEAKKADWRRVYDTPNHAIFTAINWQEFTAQRQRSDFLVMPKVTVNYEPTDDINLFASWAKAFKSAGFNEFASEGTDKSLLYKKETVTQWEINAKTNLLDGAARLDLSLFRTNLENFQVLTAEPTTFVVSVANAPLARSQGIEADLTWLPASWLTITDGLGFNDTEFLDFKTNLCPNDRENTDGDGDARCDATGKPLLRAPKWRNTLNTNVAFPLSGIPGFGSSPLWLSGGLEMIGGFTVEYVGAHFIDIALEIRQPAFFRFGANLGFRNTVQGWSLKLLGENLTNEAVAFVAADTPGIPGLRTKWPEPPRLIFGEFRWEF